MTAMIHDLLAPQVRELAMFLHMVPNAFVNHCVNACIEAIQAPFDFHPGRFVMDVRRLAGRSTTANPLFNELTKEVFAGLDQKQATYLRNLLQTTIGSGIELDKAIIANLKKVARAANPVPPKPITFSDEDNATEPDPNDPEDFYWDDVWHPGFPAKKPLPPYVKPQLAKQ